MTYPRFLRRLKRDTRGASIVEFAIIIGPLLAFVMGSLDLAWQAYATSVFQGTLQKVARLGSIENATMGALNTAADNDLQTFATASNVTVTSRSFKSFSGIDQPEKITSDTTPIGSYNSGDCYIDANSSGTYDTAQGTTGLGTADDIVEYTITMSLKRLSPVPSWIGLTSPLIISRKTVLRVEPYAGVTPPSTRCS